MATSSIRVRETPPVLHALRRADDALVLGHRLSEWCGHAPMPEEDMALANIALDLIGQARSLYAHAAVLGDEGHERTASPICGSPASTGTCCWWSSRTAISRGPSCGSSSIPPSPIPIGGQ